MSKQNENKTENEAIEEALAEFEKFLGELGNQEAAKMRKMNNRELIAYNAATRVHLVHAYALLTSSTGIMETILAQNAVIVEVLKGVVDEITFTKLIGSNNQDHTNIMAQIKKMAAKNVC